MKTEPNICQGEADQSCGGEIVPSRHDGRFYEHKGVFININPEIVIPQCNRCKSYYHTDKLIAFIDGVLEYEYNRHRDLIMEAHARDKLKA